MKIYTLPSRRLGWGLLVMAVGTVRLCAQTPPVPMASVSNETLSLGFDLGRGVALAHLVDRVTGHDYLPAAPVASPSFLRWKVKTGPSTSEGNSRDDAVVDAVTPSPDGRRLQLTAHARAVPLAFTLTIALGPGRSTAACDLSLQNMSPEPMDVQVTFPEITGWAAPGDAAQTVGTVPIEIGTVRRLQTGPALENGDVDPAVSLPHALNAVELADVSNSDGRRGLFLAALPGAAARLHLSLSASRIAGRWAGPLGPGGRAHLPTLFLGVHDGDWHGAAEALRDLAPTPTFSRVPAWLRGAGAIYAFSGGGGGGIYLTQPPVGLKDRIPSFDALPQILDDAKRLGTNVVYLWDYWEGASEGGQPPYWNKGDYVPRADMGGPEALKSGIARLHAQGGRVILYVEPFIVYRYSALGKKVGEQWAARDPQGKLYAQYPDNYTMPPTLAAWQEHVTSVAVRLVRDYGADGISLDSYGWQWNWPCRTRLDDRLVSPAEWNQGVLALTDRVRSAIRAVKPDAVVLTESFNDLLSPHVDGSLDATFAWGRERNGDRLLASPVRFLLPQINVYSNGRDLNQLNQVFAAGHGLALGPFSLPDADSIRRLVTIRQQYKDTLVYGPQAYQPETGSDTTAAYFYQGPSPLVTAVNSADAAYAGTLRLRAAEGGTRWRDLLTQEVFVTRRQEGRVELPMTIAGKTLRVLVQERP